MDKYAALTPEGGTVRMLCRFRPLEIRQEPMTEEPHETADVGADVIHLEGGSVERVEADLVRIHQGGANRIVANEVELRQGAAAAIEADTISGETFAALVIRGEQASMDRSTLGVRG